MHVRTDTDTNAARRREKWVGGGVGARTCGVLVLVAGRAGAWSYIWRGARGSFADAGAGRSQPASELGVGGAWQLGGLALVVVVECVCRWRGWSLRAGSAAWVRPADDGGRREASTTTQVVLENLTTETTVPFSLCFDRFSQC